MHLLPPPRRNHSAAVSRWLPFAAVLLVTAILFYLYNAATPLYADDYNYCYSFYDGTRIGSIGQIFPSMGRHYETMNGRLVTHFFAQLFLMWGKESFNVINTALFLGLGLLILRISGFGFGGMGAAWLACVFMLLYWITPAFGESFLWLDASATYHLGMVIILLCLLPYWTQFQKPRKSPIPLWKEALWSLGSFLLGVLAGFASENVSIALIGMVLIVTAVCFWRKDRRPWMVAGLAGLMAGYFVMLRAPGNAHRLAISGAERSLSVYAARFMDVTKTWFQYLWPLLLLFTLSLLLYFLQNRGNSLCKTLSALLPTAILSMGSLVSAYSLIAAPSFPLRAWSGVVFLSISTCGSILVLLDFNGVVSKRLVTYGIALVTVCILVSWCRNYGELLNIRTQYDARVASIESQVAQGKTDLYVHSIYTPNPYSCFSLGNDIGPDSKYWTNTIVARYWGVNSVNMIEP